MIVSAHLEGVKPLVGAGSIVAGGKLHLMSSMAPGGLLVAVAVAIA